MWLGEAEQLGLRPDLERAVAVRVFAALDVIPEDIFVSVNVSPSCLVAGVFADLVDGAPTRRIVFEVTEHAAIDDYEEVRRALAPYLDRGVRLAIDDVGAGYSSFRHVVELSPDILKLDISLISDVAVDPIEHALAETLTVFADRFDACVVAEGIETGDALATLRDLEVTYGQGYHLARPAPLPSALGSVPPGRDRPGT